MWQEKHQSSAHNSQNPKVPLLSRLSLRIPAHRGTRGELITAGIPWSATALGLLMSLWFVLGERRFGPMSAGARFIWIELCRNQPFQCYTRRVESERRGHHFLQTIMDAVSLIQYFWLPVVVLAAVKNLLAVICRYNYSIHCWKQFWVSLQLVYRQGWGAEAVRRKAICLTDSLREDRKYDPDLH